MNTEHLTPEDSKQIWINCLGEKVVYAQLDGEKKPSLLDIIKLIQYAYELGRIDERAT